MRSRAALTVALLLTVLSTQTLAALTPEQKCTAAKLKAAAKLYAGELNCYAKAVADPAPDAGCIDKARSKFNAAYAKADEKGPCAGTVEDQRTQVEACVAEAVAASVPTTTTTSSGATTTTLLCGQPGETCCGGTTCTVGCCLSGICIGEGAACSAPTCIDTTPCAFEGSSACDETGTKDQSCTPHVCTAGVCADGAAVPQTVDCTRTTDGEFCDVQSCGGLNFRDVCCSTSVGPGDNTCSVVCSVCQPL